jgi:hypothetical protein
MEYRSRWLNHAGLMSRHLEIVLYAFDREIPDGPLRLLDVGVENGGSLEIWGEILPEGSEVLGIDSDPACADLGLPVITGDVTSAEWVRGALRGRWFDVIIDSTGTMTPHLWPYLVKGGRLLIEDLHPQMIADLALDVMTGDDSWLPAEEILRVTAYPGIAVVEKSSPRIVPLLEVMAGNFADVVSEDTLRDLGVRQVVV